MLLAVLTLNLNISIPHQLFAQEFSTAENDKQLAAYFKNQTDRLAMSALENVSSLEDWKAKQNQLRDQLYEMLGLPRKIPRTDLQLKIMGKVAGKGFTVEKLHFQSRPGLYVTANLYRPEKTDQKMPAVLYVCGHGRVKENGISYGNKVHYHHHGSWFARNGYVCLTIDTLQLGEIEGIHHGTYREKMWWWLNRGYTPAGVEALNCIRSIDLLQSLPEVDADRIGVTGRSGGGAYSWWIAALDERIKCAVPVAGITDLENHVVDGCVEGHCDCMFMVNTYKWDYPMLAALVAPRPLLISNTDRDRIFPLNGVYRTYEKVKKIYALYGKSENVALHITSGPHSDTQELRVHAFRWMNHHLKNDDSLIRLPAEKFFQPNDLKVFDTLPADQQNTTIHESFVPVAKPTVPQDQQQWAELYAVWKKQLQQKVFRSSLSPSLHNTIQTKVDMKGNRFLVKETSFHDGYGVQLKMYSVSRDADKKATGATRMFLLDDPVAEKFDQWINSGFKVSNAEVLKRLNANTNTPLLSAEEFLLKSNSELLFFSPRGTGPHRWNPNEKTQTQIRRRFYLLGQSLDEVRVYDIMAAAAIHLKDRPDNAVLSLDAVGPQAGLAVYAAIFQPRIKSLYLANPPTSHRHGPILFNIRKIFDMPQAVAMAAETAAIKVSKNNSVALDALTSFEKELSQNLRREPSVEAID